MKEQIDAINVIDINITNEYSQNGEETFLRYDSKNDASKDYSAKKQRVLVFASNYVSKCKIYKYLKTDFFTKN